ncbi:hypothetical protein [Amycolatopsis sp. NPDC004079]|uniref:hypothetical protein n=1 Tax=Amycolatopsis sp. NPDC004079 TaxID=3154549 RepID=UPI0033B90AF1
MDLESGEGLAVAYLPGLRQRRLGPGEVVDLDQALRAATRDLPLPDPLPARQLLCCVQDTFAPGGLTWTHERLVDESMWPG